MLCLKNAAVLPMDGRRMIENCDVLMDEGKILRVEPNIAHDGESVDCSGLFVTPGLVDAHSHIGGLNMDGSDDADLNEMTSPVTAELDARYGIDPDSAAFRTALAQGITTSCIVPGSANVIGGWGAVVKSVGPSLRERIIKSPAVLKAALGINPKGVYAAKQQAPMTRMAIAEMLREYFRKVREYATKKAAAGDDATKAPPFDLAMEHGLPVLEKRIPLKVHSYMHDMLTVLDVADEFDIDVTIDHAQGATDFLDEIAANPHVRGVIYGPIALGIFPGEGGKIDYNAPWKLCERGVPAAIMTDGPVTNAASLVYSVGEVVREGMDPIEALKLVTVNPARILGVEDRVGALREGMDADIAVFDAQPGLDPRAHVVRVYSEGKLAYRA